MTPKELLETCAHQTSIGLSFVTLTIPMRRTTSNRVRVMPGVMGHVVGSTDKRLVVSCQVRDVVRALEKVMLGSADD